MSDTNRPLSDNDSEEILRLILSEAAGADVRSALQGYPQTARNKFRQVVHEAGLVRANGFTTTDSGEVFFEEPKQLTERGRKRLSELNVRRGAQNGRSV